MRKLAASFDEKKFQIEPRFIEKIFSSRDSGLIESSREKVEQENCSKICLFKPHIFDLFGENWGEKF